MPRGLPPPSVRRAALLRAHAPLAVFFGALYAVLRRVEGGSGALAAAVFAAGLTGSLLAPMTALVEGHLLLGLAAAGADPLVAVGFDGMTPLAFSISALPQLVVLVGTSTLLRAERGVSRWITWLGSAAAALGLLSLGVMLQSDLIFLGIVSAILYKVWMIVVSVALLRGPLAARRALRRSLQSRGACDITKIRSSERTGRSLSP